MAKYHRFWHALPAALSIVMGVVLLLIIGMLLFGQQVLAYAYQNRSLLSNLVLLPAALCLIAVGLYFVLTSRIHPRKAWPLIIYFAVLLVVQLIVARSTWFYAGWDVETNYLTAESLARGEAITTADYYRLCPNNAPVTVMLAGVIWVGLQLGMAVPYALLPYFGALILNVACLLAVLCVRRLTQNRAVVGFTLAIFTVWIALSPYMTVPYTDTYAIIFPLLVLYIYLSTLPLFPKWLLISFFSIFGASMKPQAIILFIAIMILALCRALARGGLFKVQRERAVTVFLAVGLGVLPAMGWHYTTIAALSGSVNPQEQLGATHYLMMGMNTDTLGGHSPGDVAYSTSFATRDERSAANMQRAWERLSALTPAETVRFFAGKAYKAYADGTFASNTSTLTMSIPKRTDGLSVFLRSIYYANGGLNQPFATLHQAIWLAVLLLSCWAALAVRNARPIVPVLALALMGLTIYELLVEVWPRYLFVYAPIFVILASLGLESLSGKCRALIQRLSHRKA